MLKYLTTTFLTFLAKVSAIALVGILVFSVIPTNSYETQLIQSLSSIQKARGVVVKLVSQNPAIGSSCSAVVISANKALTAAHCINIPQLAIKYDDGRVFPVLAVLPDIMGRDVATLFVPHLDGPFALTTASPVKPNELVYAVGYPYGIGNILTIGQFQFRVTNPEDGQKYLISTVMVGPGNSGGALFVVRDGIPLLVGITVAYAGSPHLAVAVELP